MSKTSNIELADRWYRGEAKNLAFDIVDANDAALDVSSFALTWVLETGGGEATDTLKKTTGGSGITVVDGAGTKDRVVVAITAADTLTLAPQVYRHSLWRTDANNEQLLSEGSAMLQAAAEVDVS